MKKLLAVFFILVLFGNAISQERWVPDGKSMPKPPLGKYTFSPALPKWENPNKQTTYYYSPFGINAVGPNIRVLPNSNEQDEVILVSQTANPNFMFGSANTTVGSTYGQGCYVTTNGGLNWYGTDLMPNEPGMTSDPGPTIDKNGIIVFTSLNTVGTAFMYSQYSTNFGVNWSTPITISSVSADKNFAGTDDYPTSAFYGHSYCVWSNFASSAPPIVFSYTTNSGVSWSSVSQINTPPSGHYSQGCDIIVGPGGIIYVTWAAPTSSSPYTEDYFGFAKSTNGGSSWTVTENAFDGNGIRSSSYNGWGVRVNSFPRIGVDRSGGPRNGWIYIVTSQINLAPAGSDADVVLHRSTDGGATWSAGIRANQDAMNNGKVQFFPSIRVDESGGVNIVYYDNRNYPSVGDSAETYLSRSLDGGNTWTDIKVSDHRWKPVGEGGSGSYMGDYIGITSGNNKVWPFWFDNKTGHMQAWTCAVEFGPAITHTPLGNTELISGTRAVNCVITPSGSGINPSTVQLKYAKNSTSWTTVQMTNSGGTNWTGNITLSGAGTYNYYVTATDSLARIATAPAGAPANYYSFLASTDTVKPVITHTAIPNTPKLAWPTTVSATVTDNIGVDSAWVRWRINSGATKHFKLNFTSGNNYSALFNSIQSEVNAGDLIYYKIYAQDNSSQHNRDSTSQYSFTIIAQATACIGSGTVQMGSSASPYNTYWYGARTQLLFTAAEILANQGGAGNITKIGFQIATVGGQGMTGLNIRMQATTMTSISSFTSTGWTTVYTGNYTVPGTGWQYIDLTTPFAWNGTSNILIEVCFGNTSYTTATTVLGTAATNMYRTEYHDLSTACAYTGFTTGTNQTSRANTCFVINTSSNVNPINKSIPTTYSLNQNYPNPFNPVTRINFAIPKQGLVSLKVYDVLGREVKSLVNDVKAPGEYSVDFNGNELSSGVYFYKLESNGYSDIKKMMLIK